MLTRINSIADKYSRLSPLTNVYGLARSLFALSTLIALTFTNAEDLFFATTGGLQEIYILSSVNIFYIFGHNNIVLTKWISIVILLFVLIGYRPKYTGILHWWVTFSFYSACPIIDGGDQIASIITLFLIPICLIDDRKYHWHKIDLTSKTNEYIVLLIWSFFLIIRIQVSFIYFHAAIAKMMVADWINGTDTYYWFTHPVHGAAPWLRPFAYFIMAKPFVVVCITWGTMLFELFLSFILFTRRGLYLWRFFLYGGILFHLGIVFFHGLASFFLVMTACLILYLYPVHYEMNLGANFKYLKIKR